MTRWIDRVREPAYTGENRCTPCTAVNLVIAAALGALVGVVWLPLGLAVFCASVASIYLRGYLVPGTPELTKRYFPDWLLARFDKAERPGDVGGETVGGVTDETTGGRTADGSSATGAAPSEEDLVDPETLLAEAGAIEETEDGRDVRLTAAFAAEWQDAVDRLRDDEEALRERAARLTDHEVDRIEIDRQGRWRATTDAGTVRAWVSGGAALADLAAADVLAERAAWDAVLPRQRAAILRALRSFYDTCAQCGGRVELTEETVASCCRSWEVLAVRCVDCEEHYLEIDPETMAEADAAPTGDRTEGGSADGTGGRNGVEW